ncbi:MAG: dihydroorotate dehydrogenase [Candidatus Omnitrophota bacterium]
MVDLAVKIGKIKLKNPVTVASGTFGFAEEFKHLTELRALGGVITKSITLEPRQGNLPPRIVETASGMLNAIGLQNPGIETFIKEKLPRLKELRVPVIVSIAGKRVEDYVALAKRLSACKGVDALEVNISCPNVKQGGAEFGKNEKIAASLVRRVRKITPLTLIAKLSPNVSDISKIAVTCEREGADALSLVNTFLAMAVDVNTRKPELANITGGLSGPAIKPIALRMVWEAAKRVKVPIIGMGGIMNAGDAIEFLLCGADAVCVGTANFVEPNAAVEIIDGIEKYMKENKISRIRQLTGGLGSRM